MPSTARARTPSRLDDGATPRRLRHVCASPGADIKRVRERMGHKTVAVTQRVYRHALIVDRRKLAKQPRLPTVGIEVDDSMRQAPYR
jgi:integrase